jgi:hypothetical protein
MHGENMTTMRILGDAAPAAQDALAPHRCVRRDARQQDSDRSIQWRHGDNPGLIDTQIARDVVAGDEQAYAELAKHVPIGRVGRPEEIASVVLWLCSPGASYVVGHALTVDGGMTVL